MEAAERVEVEGGGQVGATRLFVRWKEKLEDGWMDGRIGLDWIGFLVRVEYLSE